VATLLDSTLAKRRCLRCAVVFLRLANDKKPIGDYRFNSSHKSAFMFTIFSFYCVRSRSLLRHYIAVKANLCKGPKWFFCLPACLSVCLSACYPACIEGTMDDQMNGNKPLHSQVGKYLYQWKMGG